MINIPNFAISSPSCVVIQAIQYEEDDGTIYYRPLVAFFLNEDIENPVITSMFVNEKYDCPEELAKKVCQWANMAWPVSMSVSVIRFSNGEVIEKIDCKQAWLKDKALEELSKIVRTNTSLIH
jgi:hypothetical protein